MKKFKQKLENFKNKNTAAFFILGVVVVYVVLKFLIGLFVRWRNDAIIKKTNSENAEVQKSNSDTSANAVRADICKGIADSIKNVMDNYGFFEKWVSFNPTKYIQDVNRLNGKAEAIYISKYYQNAFGTSLKVALQTIAYSENPLFSWETKGGRYSDLKTDIKQNLF